MPTCTNYEKKRIGARLLPHLQELKPVLIETQIIDARERNRLPGRNWIIPERQVETSVVLVDANWRARLLSDEVK
jgi:hypothetical protein